MKIMNCKNGTIIKNNRSGSLYVVKEWVNDVAREIVSVQFGMTDYINSNTQDEYTIVED